MSDSGRCIGQERERQWDDRDTEIAELRSEVERLTARLADATRELCDARFDMGVAQGELMASEDAACLEGWIKRAEAAEKRVKWQPIETAPKDGTILWGWLRIKDGTNRHYQDTVAWFASSYHDGSGWWVSRAQPVEPALWMPLPTPPAATGHGGG